MKRITQPPVSPGLRDPERHDFVPGFILAVIGLLVLFSGARHITNVDTVEGNSAWEMQLVKAFTSGGLEYANPSEAPPPALDDPAAEARFQAQFERAPAATAKYRVNTGAQNPCPT
jgi:hypothetical protein